MKVIITGATGFIGRNLVNNILQNQINIDLLLPCRDIVGATTLFNTHRFHNIRVVSSEDWTSITDFKPEIVIHLAAFSSSNHDVDTIGRLFESNIMYGIKLLNALHNCPSMRLFVNTGSFAEYRMGPWTIDNAYLYSATKSAFRPLLDFYAKLSGYKYITAIPYSVYGGKSNVKRLFDYMLNAINSKEPVDMTGGEQVLDFIHVDDVCEFYLSTILNFEKYMNFNQGKEFHIGTGFGHSIREVAHIIESITGKSLNVNWGALPYRERDTMYAVAPISGNENMWHSKVALQEGIQKYIKLQ